MKLIKFRDKNKTIINLEHIEFIETNYYNFYIGIGFISGKYKEIRYEVHEERSLREDINMLNDECHVSVAKPKGKVLDIEICPKEL